MGGDRRSSSRPGVRPGPPERRRPGDAVVLRELWRGRVWAARPATVVEDGAHRVFYVPAGVTFKWPIDRDGRVLHVPTGDWRLVDFAAHRPVLSFARPSDAHAVMMFGEDGGGFTGFYVNLQSPLVPTGIGFDFEDHLLDVLVSPDRTSWRWKDEEDLALAVARGELSTNDADAIRAEGVRAVERIRRGEPPFDRDWSSWRPDPAWPLPALPEGWDAV